MENSLGASVPPEPDDSGRARVRRLDDAEEARLYVELWKKSVDVQQHFNDIEWRIRGLALTAATFALGAAGLAAKDGSRFRWVSPSALMVIIGLVLWYAFYFVDRHWYHPLLKSAVKQGTKVENELRSLLPAAGMTAEITAGSPQETNGIVRFLSRSRRMHSDDKLVWFYKVGAGALCLAGVLFQLGAVFQPSTSDSGPNNVINVVLDGRTLKPVQGTPSGK